MLCLGRAHQHPESNKTWKERIGWIVTDKSHRDYDGINGEPTEFEWNIFPRFTTLQLCGKVTDLLSRLGETPETFTRRILFMSMFNDISCGTKDNEKECLANAKLVSLYARRFGKEQWSFIGPGSEKKWYSISEDSPQSESGTKLKKGCWNSLRADVQFSVLRLLWDNQLRSVRSRQKFLWRVMIQHIRIFLLQQYEERIERLSQQDKLSKICMDAESRSEYTLPREEGASQPRGWIQGNTKNWTRVGSYDQLLAW